MSFSDEITDYRRKAEETVERHRKAKARVRFVDRERKPIQGLEVRIAQKTQDFLFSNLLFDLVGDEPPYQPELFKQRFLELFNLAVFPFYWPLYEKTPGHTEWQKMMPVLEWCRANQVTAKGHPLVWPYSAGVPEWLYEMPRGSTEAFIQARVLNLVKGFAPWIHVWDVTNEAVNHVSWDEATAPEFLPRYHEVSVWRGIEVSGAFKREIPIGQAADWVEKSFGWAYAANPRAALILNDYNQEFDPNIRRRFYELVRELQRRQAPVSGIGLQMHPINHWLRPHEIWETLELYAELDCPIHITELHQPTSNQEIEGGYRNGTWTPQAQSELMEQVYRQCFGHPSVVSVNYWGLSDRNSWIPGGGLLDAEYQPKRVFNVLKDLIKGEWITPPFTARTDENGEIVFRGFCGQYEITECVPVRRVPPQSFHLTPNQELPITLTN